MFHDHAKARWAVRLTSGEEVLLREDNLKLTVTADENELVTAVQRVRLASANPLSVAQVHAALQGEGNKADLAAVKKASSKAAKRQAPEPKPEEKAAWAGDPRADPDKDYCLSELTPDAMRSIQLGRTSGGKIASISPKDMMTSSMLMARATQQLRRDDWARATQHAEADGDDGPVVYLWELTLKLRVCASDADEFMTFGGLQKMAQLSKRHSSSTVQYE